MESSRGRRITMKLRTPNPLFVKWLKEWRDQARKDNSKMQYCFQLALQSLQRYPVPLESGKDCKILKGFGDKLCLMLDNKLKEHQMNVSSNINNIEPLQKKRKTAEAVSSQNKSRRSVEYIPREDSGAYAILVTLYTQSLDPSYKGFLTKQEIITEGQHLSHTSFTKPDPGIRYTAWSSMKTLIAKNLVIKKNTPAKFSLSEEGLTLARKLFDKGKNSLSEGTGQASEENKVICIDLSDDEEPAPSTSGVKCGSSSEIAFDIDYLKLQQSNFEEIYSAVDERCRNSALSTYNSKISLESEAIFTIHDKKVETNYKYTSSSLTSTDTFNSVNSLETKVVSGKGKSNTIQKHPSSSSAASSSSSQEECFIFPPNTFDIILVIDTCETSGSNALIQDDPILAELFKLGIMYEVKKLTIGDYVWIGRDRVSKKELVLPYIVERKRMDDLASSIKDGRYHEQKFRLKRCGIQNVIYLIEKYGNNQYVGLPVSSLHQAATNTAIQDGFCVRFTQNIRDTAKYLANLSTILIEMFKSKTLVSCPKENLSAIEVEDDLVSLMTFKEFNQASVKNKPMTVSDLFVKMLLQIKGMSVDKALAIVSHYPTPALLWNAYEENSEAAGEKLLATIQFGDSQKKIGPVLSRIVHQLFTLRHFN